MKIISSILIMLSLGGCASFGNRHERALSIPDYNPDAIVSRWGYPAEILLRENDVKLNKFVVTWVYYIEDSDKLISPVFYNFRHGKVISTNSAVVMNGNYRMLDTRKIEDLKSILKQRKDIRKRWSILAVQLLDPNPPVKSPGQTTRVIC